jgi:hypothetical protein
MRKCQNYRALNVPQKSTRALARNGPGSSEGSGHAYEGLEEFAERSEAAHENVVRTLRDNSEADFRGGRTVTWGDVKARNGL